MEKTFYWVAFLTLPLLVLNAPAVLAATCAVPHTLSNGQVANAADVMDNFNAIANCTEGAVTTAGTPNAGSIAIFSGTGTIGSGNLTGDVTTAGSAAVTLSNSGVTPGIYTSANISVDAKGRIVSAASGSGGGETWWFAPPSATQFTLGSGSSTFLTLADDIQAGLLVDGGAPAPGDVNRIAYQTLTDKNAAWDLKARIEGVVPTNNWSGYGLAMRDSVSSRITTLTIRGDGAFAANNWNGYSGYSGTPGMFSPRTPIYWFRIQHIGAIYNFYTSPDGKQWTQIFTVGDTSWLTNKADQVGIAIDYNRTSGIKNTMAVQYYSLTQ